MRLASFVIDGQHQTIGAVVDVEGSDVLVDARAVWSRLGVDAPPATMLELLERGEPGLEAMRAALSHVESEASGGWDAVISAGLAHRADEVGFLPPVRPGKVISVGLNYHSHLEEFGMTLDKGEAQPAFAKFPSVLTGHETDIVCPRSTEQLDYEIELCLVIGQRCRDVSKASYLDPVVGFTTFNDISMRDIQSREQNTFHLLCLGKNLDGCGPLGPYLVTKDEIADPADLSLQLRVNGEVRQDGHTSDMIYSLPEIMAYWSQMTLEPGDVITTGTPSGVGGATPDGSKFLRPGDVIEAEITGLGVLRNRVVAP